MLLDAVDRDKCTHVIQKLLVLHVQDENWSGWHDIVAREC